jgi:hypothetical protein
MSDDLNLIQIAVRVGMSCALTALSAVGIFMIIRFVAWIGSAALAQARRIAARFGHLPSEKPSNIVSGICLKSLATTSRTVAASSPNALSA